MADPFTEEAIEWAKLYQLLLVTPNRLINQNKLMLELESGMKARCEYMTKVYIDLKAKYEDLPDCKDGGGS